MATRRVKSVKVLTYSEGFTAGLSAAVLEWLLIFLLFVNAVFSYLVTKFAHFCQLKIPCLLCSRLDHVFGNEKPGFYRDLICGVHKAEISSLVRCHVHDKLADVHGMCEACLFSSVTEKKSNAETYRLLVGKLGIDHEGFVDKKPLLKHPILSSLSERQCSCCDEISVTRPFTPRLLQKTIIASKVSESDGPLPGSVGNSEFNLFDGLKRRRENLFGSMAHSHPSCGFDPLSHVGYSELKITSDSESEIPLSDDDDASTLGRETNNHKEEMVARFVQPVPRTIVSDTLLNVSLEVLVPNKLIDQDSTPVPSLLVHHEQHDVGELYHMTSSASDMAVGHGLEELNWQQLEQKSHTPAVSDLISLDEVPSQSHVVETVVEVSNATSDVMGTGNLLRTSTNESGGVYKSETGLLAATRTSLEKDLVQVSGETSDFLGSVDVGQVSSAGSGEVSSSDYSLPTTTGRGLKTPQVTTNPGPSKFSLMDLGDAYKLAVGNKGGQASSINTEQHIMKDSAKVTDDLKLLISQISATRGSDLSVNDMSPRVRGLHEELKIPDGSSSIELDTLQKRISIDRNESGFESLDGSVVSDIEGESLADRMKRQLEYDRKCMSALYKELDEERNASAIAANQAMAMITRLQEEKAALHMEALQYLRMMEEQAEYDVEALQKANDLLAEREKEMQDMEAELDYYKIKYPDEGMEDNLRESCYEKVADMRVGPSDLNCTGNNSNGPCNLRSIKIPKDDKSEKTDAVPSLNDISIIKDSFLNFEDESLYILQCLKRLEKQLHSLNGVHMEMCNGVYSGKEVNGFDDVEQDHSKELVRESNIMEEDGTSMQKYSYLSREGSPARERSSASAGELQPVSQENNYLDRADTSIASTTTDLVSIENEVLDLNERLETLEADRDFLEHTINSLRNGDDGVKFIQEIAHHLRELRRIGLRRREKDVA